MDALIDLLRAHAWWLFGIGGIVTTVLVAVVVRPSLFRLHIAQHQGLRISHVALMVALIVCALGLGLSQTGSEIRADSRSSISVGNNNTTTIIGGDR